ncbi:hypothetical protein [Nocardia sp. NPDC057440]|uniref:hypothetical protein n=1 Tax=Nocardia sp. NPDC057440 TaxID=3346134 RepID=UPI00366F41FC
MQTDNVTWKMRARVLKYEPETIANLTDRFGHEPSGSELRALESLGLLAPDDIVDVIGNALVNVGKQRLSDLITGTGQAFTTSRGVTGVGNSTTAVGGSDVALLGASQLYKALDGAPTSVTGVITASTTFTGSDANFAWEEWCWAIATAAPVTNASFATATTSGVMVNRKVQSLGTKVSGAVWTLQATATIS